MNKILLIEDDTGIYQSLKLYLENSNFFVDLEVTGEFAVEKIKTGKYDLVILDLNLPKKDGITICKETRDFSDIPIIMLTARTSQLDKINGLDLGADDYISKPFSPRELLSRINTILRRTAKIEELKEILVFKDITIDIDKNIVTKGTQIINFTKNEFDIFKKIVKENGKIVERETLMIDVIGYDNYAFDRTIDTHIKNIRKKINDKDLIITIRGKGYRLNN